MAAQRGFGTVYLDEIDFQSEVEPPVAHFDSDLYLAPEILHTLRRTACEQGLFYQDRKKDMIDKYRNDFIYMQEGDVVWHGQDPSIITSHREFSGTRPGSALWLKLVDPNESEGERFEVYDKNLAALSA